MARPDLEGYEIIAKALVKDPHGFKARGDFGLLGATLTSVLAELRAARRAIDAHNAYDRALVHAKPPGYELDPLEKELREAFKAYAKLYRPAPGATGSEGGD